MKKYLFFGIFLAIGAMSCQKDIEQGSITSAVTPTDTKQTSLFDQTKPVENDDVYVKIDAFKAKLAKIEAGMLPENDNGTSVDDAIWNIEALLNSRYGHAGKPFKSLNELVGSIRVPLNTNGTIDNVALLTAVEAARQRLSEQYQSISTANKHVVAIDTRKKEPQIESPTSVIIEVAGLIAGGSDQSDLSDFGIDDHWQFGFHLGKCIPPVVTDVGTDAADKFNERLNPRFTSIDVFFSDISSIFFGEPPLANPDPNDTPGDSIRDFLTYFQDVSIPFSTCISPSDMNFYLHGTVAVIENFRPSGKKFLGILGFMVQNPF